MKLRYIQFIWLGILVFSGTSGLLSQDLDREVYVVSTYRPEIADAEKIAGMPSMEDTMKLETPSDYTLLPSRINTEFSPRPIKPAKMVGTPLDKFYNSYLKLGIGNYFTPLAEYSIHNLRSKDYAIGAYYFHKSSHTKLTLDNSAEVPAGYGKNDLSLYGKKFYKDATLLADVGFSRYKLRYYGYNTANFPDSVPEPEASDIKQWFNLIYGQLGLKAAAGDSSAPDYSLTMRGEYLADYYGSKEPHFLLKGDISFPVKSFRVGLSGDYDYFKLTYGDSISSEAITSFRPYVLKRNSEWEVKIAGKISILSGDASKVYFYPDLSIKFQIINNALVSFFGLSGYLQNNSYQGMAALNPYILPGAPIRNTNHQLIAFAGLEGHLSRTSAYRIDVTFDAIQDMPFFLNDTNSLMQNKFGLVYDDADQIRIHGEIGWKPFTYLSFFTQLNLYNYKMVAEARPWHRPNVDFTFTTRYNFKKKIYAELDYLILGKRYAKNLYDGSPEIELKPVHDLNLKLEYRYSDILSGFVHFYNLLSQEYYLWNQYPSQRINVLLGVTYKF